MAELRYSVIVYIYLFIIIIVLFYICEELIASVRIPSTLSFLDMTSKFRAVAMFTIVYLRTKLQTQCVSVWGLWLYHTLRDCLQLFIRYRHKSFPSRKSNESLCTKSSFGVKLIFGQNFLNCPHICCWVRNRRKLSDASTSLRTRFWTPYTVTAVTGETVT